MRQVSGRQVKKNEKCILRNFLALKCVEYLPHLKFDLFCYKLESFRKSDTVDLSILKRERFPLFVPKRYCVLSRSFLGVQRSWSFSWTFYGRFWAFEDDIKTPRYDQERWTAGKVHVVHETFAKTSSRCAHVHVSKSIDQQSVSIGVQIHQKEIIWGKIQDIISRIC